MQAMVNAGEIVIGFLSSFLCIEAESGNSLFNRFSKWWVIPLSMKDAALKNKSNTKLIC